MLQNHWTEAVAEVGLKFDAARMAAQVISGIGFLGAGYYELGILGTALILLAETWFAKLGATIQKRPEYVVEVLYRNKEALDQVLRYCKDSRMAITSLQIHSLDNNPDADYAAEVNLRGQVESGELTAHIALMPGVVSAVDISG